MTEPFWSGSFDTKAQFREFIRTEAENWFEPDDIWPYVHDECGTFEEHENCITDGEGWALDNGYHEAIDYATVVQQHDESHTGSVKWCTEGLCAPVVFSGWFGHLY